MFNIDIAFASKEIEEIETIEQFLAAKEKLLKEIFCLRIQIIVKADGKDLEYIKKLYGVNVNPTGYPTYTYSIPMVENAKSMTWCGDIAKTIIQNLC